MFGLFRKKHEKNPTETSLPTPLAGRTGHIGGIESILLDETTYFFGFDYRNDLVVSPLVNDIDVIAGFASKYMLQRDGAHDESYWRELAGYGSDICDDVEDRTFTSKELALMMARLRHAQMNDVSAPDFTVKYHLRYLLGSAGGWAASAEFDSTDENMEFIRGEKPLPTGTHFFDVARELQTHLGALVNAAPENWSTLFAVLKS